MTVIVVTSTGESWRLAGCCTDIMPQITAAKLEGLLVELPCDAAADGTVWLNPAMVVSVRDV